MGWLLFSEASDSNLENRLQVASSTPSNTSLSWAELSLCKCQFWKERLTEVRCSKLKLKLQCTSPRNGKSSGRTFSLWSFSRGRLLDLSLLLLCSAMISCCRSSGVLAGSTLSSIATISSSFCLLFTLTCIFRYHSRQSRTMYSVMLFQLL